jgi:hypothetical protein
MTVLVGRDGRDGIPFTVDPKSLLQRSTFFKRALRLESDPQQAELNNVLPTAKFKHGDKVVVYLPEIQEPNFKLYAAWINDGQIDYHQIQPHLADEATNTSTDVPYFVNRYRNRAIGPITAGEFSQLADQSMELLRSLMSLWIDTDFLCDFKLQNKIMDEMAKLFLDEHDFPTPTCIPMDIVHWVVEYTGIFKGVECPLFEFCIHYFDFRCVSACDVQATDGYGPHILGEGLEALERDRRRGCPRYDPRLGFSRTPKWPGDHGRYHAPEWA